MARTGGLSAPVVAIARFVVFAALALHEHPPARERVRTGTDADVRRFVQEVRRFYPFFPAVAGRVLAGFAWRGHRFGPGDRVLFDLYGTDHDPAVWPRPGVFDPERFPDRGPTPLDLVAQGGSEHRSGHRCPGEWATIALMQTATIALTWEMTYDTPAQDLRMSLSRLPAVPGSRFVIERVTPG